MSDSHSDGARSEQAPSAREVVSLGEGIFQLPTDYPEVCNAPLWSYLLASGDHFAVIDPGVRSTFAATLSGAIESIGLELNGADLLLATHGHPDHSGGQSSWKVDAPHALIAAPLIDAPWVESFDRQWVQFWDDYPGVIDNRPARDLLMSLCVPEPTVNLLLRDGDEVVVGERRLSVVETRGHSWGHCAYFDYDTRTIFTGDAVQGRGIPSSDQTTVFAPLYLNVDEARWGLQRLLDIPFDQMCPAHAAPMDRETGMAFLQQSVDFIDEVDAMARTMVDQVVPSPLFTRDLAIAIGELVGASPALTPQTAATARAHLYQLAREDIIDAAWVSKRISNE